MDQMTLQNTIHAVHAALLKKGYNPIVQLTGYILTEDPTYITNYQGARSLISRIKKEDLLTEIVSFYFEATEKK
jgi:uncharacterized protein (UPF0297 family)